MDERGGERGGGGTELSHVLNPSPPFGFLLEPWSSCAVTECELGLSIFTEWTSTFLLWLCAYLYFLRVSHHQKGESSPKGNCRWDCAKSSQHNEVACLLCYRPPREKDADGWVPPADAVTVAPSSRVFLLRISINTGGIAVPYHNSSTMTQSYR